MTKGFLISEGLRDKIHATIERVAGTPYGGGVTNVTPRLENIQAAQQKLFRICTFTGAWSIGSAKAVTFRGVTSTPNTVTAVNLFATVQNTATKNCAIAKDGTAWYLIAAEC